MKNSILLLVFGLICTSAIAQQDFLTKEYVDINNIKACVLVHGDLNWDVIQGSQCEFPKGSGKHVSSATSIWMAGYDAQSQLHVSAQTYRQVGNDYWPGPLDNNASLNFATSTNWARIWKISRSDIINHLANSTHTTGNTPKDILEWPAKGNSNAKGNNSAALTITKEMAPFVDVNNDGTYNALDGDYPMIKGDQMLWWVFSDNGPTHDNTSSQSLGIEVHASAYAYNKGTLVDNIIFYEMKLNNRSNNDYSTYRMGLFADTDLGYFDDDYVGFDSSRRLGYTYNATSTDGSGQSYAYGDHPPIAGFTLLKTPGDNNGNIEPTGSFLAYKNDASIMGNPLNAVEFNNYLRSQNRISGHLKNDYTSYGNTTTGTGIGPNTDYLFTGDPADTSQWSECSSTNPAGDRRFVLATSDYTFKANTATTIAFALVVTDTGQNTTCPSIDITNIQRVSDTAWEYYYNPPSPVNIKSIAKNRSLSIYPNPANDILYITPQFNISNDPYNVIVYDMTGKKVTINYELENNKIAVNTSNLPAGVYHIVYDDTGRHRAATFVKK